MYLGFTYSEMNACPRRTVVTASFMKRIVALMDDAENLLSRNRRRQPVGALQIEVIARGRVTLAIDRAGHTAVRRVVAETADHRIDMEQPPGAGIGAVGGLEPRVRARRRIRSNASAAPAAVASAGHCPARKSGPPR